MNIFNYFIVTCTVNVLVAFDTQILDAQALLAYKRMCFSVARNSLPEYTHLVRYRKKAQSEQEVEYYAKRLEERYALRKRS